MTKPISTPSRTKEILEKYNLRAKKNFGQNFLVDPVIVQRCAEESHSEGAVIEIGPGIGSLTEQLAIVSKHVTAYEIDERLIPVLKDTLSEYKNVEIILGDFLERDITNQIQELKKEYGTVSVCANLPYYITSQVLFKLFDEDVDTITVMVQKEVGDRFAAQPNDADYSALSVEGQYLFHVKKLFTVPGRSFNPSPAVDSVILQFVRKEQKKDLDVHAFNTFVRACFKQRRKTIYNNLKEYLGNKEKTDFVLEKVNISPQARAQSLTVEEFEKLFEATL